MKVTRKKAPGTKKSTGTKLAKVDAPKPDLSPEKVAALAHAIWEREGRPHGRDAQHWQQAEAELRQKQKR